MESWLIMAQTLLMWRDKELNKVGIVGCEGSKLSTTKLKHMALLEVRE